MKDPAAQRFWIIQTVRLFGAAVAVCGLIVVGRPDTGLPAWAGMLLVVAGLVAMMIVPRFLVRRWRTPPDEQNDP